MEKLVLLFHNMYFIFFSDYLTALQSSHPNRFTVHHILSKPLVNQPWDYSIGYITTDLIQKQLFDEVDEHTAIVICGPPAMRTKAVLPALEEIGVPKEQIFEM